MAGNNQLPNHSVASMLGVSEATLHRWRRRAVAVGLLDVMPDAPKGRRQRANRWHEVRPTCEQSRAASSRRRMKHKAEALERERYWARKREAEAERRHKRAAAAVAEFRRKLGAEFAGMARASVALALAGEEYDPWAEAAAARRAPMGVIGDRAQGEFYLETSNLSEMPARRAVNDRVALPGVVRKW